MLKIKAERVSEVSWVSKKQKRWGKVGKSRRDSLAIIAIIAIKSKYSSAVPDCLRIEKIATHTVLCNTLAF